MIGIIDQIKFKKNMLYTNISIFSPSNVQENFSFHTQTFITKNERDNIVCFFNVAKLMSNKIFNACHTIFIVMKLIITNRPGVTCHIYVSYVIFFTKWFGFLV